jgi:hypothetical protein
MTRLSASFAAISILALYTTGTAIAQVPPHPTGNCDAAKPGWAQCIINQSQQGTD